MPEESKKITIDLNSTWIKVLAPILITAILGEGVAIGFSDQLFGAEGSEKYAVGIRCDASECVYRDEGNDIFEARRGDDGDWLYKKRGNWYYVADDYPYEGY